MFRVEMKVSKRVQRENGGTISYRAGGIYGFDEKDELGVAFAEGLIASGEASDVDGKVLRCAAVGENGETCAQLADHPGHHKTSAGVDFIEALESLPELAPLEKTPEVTDPIEPAAEGKE